MRPFGAARAKSLNALLTSTRALDGRAFMPPGAARAKARSSGVVYVESPGWNARTASQSGLLLPLPLLLLLLLLLLPPEATDVPIAEVQSSTTH